MFIYYIKDTLANRYIIVFIFSVLELIVSAISADNHRGWLPVAVLLSGFALGYSIITCLWIGILLFHIKRPRQSYFFNKKAVHLASFIVFALTWPVFGILIFVLLCNGCTPPGADTYGAVVFAGVFSIFLAFSSLMNAIRVGLVKVGPDGNIAGPSFSHDA